MRLRAKFYVTSLELLPGKDAGVKLNLGAVSRGDRNTQWATATPVGQLTMTINNPAAAHAAEEFMQAARTTGKQPEVYINIAPSEDGWPGDGHTFRLGDWPEGHYAYGKCGDCGLGKDDTLVEYEPSLGKNIERGPAHPNG